MIKSFYFDHSTYKNYNTTNDDRTLQNLSRINIFIGQNNSGKSRFSRMVFADEGLQYISEEVDLKAINALIKDFKIEIAKYVENNVTNDEEVINQLTKKIETINFIMDGVNLNTSIRKHLQDAMNFNGRTYSKYNSSESDIRSHISKIAKTYLEKFDSLSKNFPTDFKLRNFYIPTLRGMRKLNESNDDLYLNTTITDYFIDKPHIHRNIITGLKLNEEIKEHLLGSRSQRKQVRDFENFLSKNFFDEKDVNIIPKTKGGVIHFMIGDEEKEIFNLGDGIQSIIILTYPLFFNQDKKMNFFIEEPEHYLHPGFQRIFIETLLLPQFENFQYFITTHSNHLLDVTLDVSNISIYTFKRSTEKTDIEANFVIENVANGESNTLELIGVRNSSVFLSNSTIWVEGITDRIYLRKYLDIFQKDKKQKFVEDIHYSFVEYGGGNITHWSFLESYDENHPNIQVERLCAKLFLISDGDNARYNSSSKKALRHEQLSRVLGDRYCCLKANEIENLLLPEIIKKVILDYEMGNDALNFKPFEIVDYQNEYLGTFIENNIENRKRSYADNSGTIKDKVNFSKKAVSFIERVSDLSQEVLELCERLYNFIKSQNM